MSFAAEPYGVYVDDLVTALTGGVTREDFVFLPERAPFRLAFGRDHVPGTVRVHGLAGGAFQRFEDGVDYGVDGDGVLAWSASGAQPAARATWPDAGSHFYASYERVPDPQAPPRLSDRNPGSVVRTLAESFAREYAVISRQMESVYRAAFLDTADGGDLDHVAALVGIVRRKPTFAAGEIVLSRRSPAPADIFVPEGTRVSTSDVPPIAVLSTEARTLRAGSLSVSVPVAAEVEGMAGIARPGTLTVINRPILGVDSATNPSALALGGSAETDDALRRRTSKALETSGRATIGSLVGALTSVEGIRPQDVRVTEDHVGFPGLVKVIVAAELTADQIALAAAQLEDARPAGIRVAHNLPVQAASPPAGAPDGGRGAGEPPPPPPVAVGSRYPIGATVTAVPARPDLTTRDKAALVDQVRAAVTELVGDLAVGETLVYNRLVSAVMAVEGVLDAIVDVYPVPAEATTAGDGVRVGRSNVTPLPSDTRLQLDTAQLSVSVWGAIVAFDVRVAINALGYWADADVASVASDARLDISRRLTEYLRTRPPKIGPDDMAAALAATDLYAIVAGSLGFTLEYVEDGLLISKPGQSAPLRADQAGWVRSVAVTVQPATGTGQ